jgi:cobyrinic acid a,c-diamide synthase
MPRIVIGAPASGHGKTTVATGLIAAFARRGLDVAPFKVGPDYIDPGYHALAAAEFRAGAGRTARAAPDTSTASPTTRPPRPGRNLDPFLVGEQRIRDLFAHGSRGADIAVIEGVMGLYDGAHGVASGVGTGPGTNVGARSGDAGFGGEGEFASTAHVARLLDAPVILVVDAAAQGRSIAALVHGFRSFDPAVRLAGVILNRVGSVRHQAILADALESIGVPLLGAMHRSDAVSAPSRHLGLVPVAERAPESRATIDALAHLAASTLDLEAVERLARSAPPLAPNEWTPAVALAQNPEGNESDPDVMRPGERPVIAVAAGAAFTFSYAEHVELLTAAGAQVVPFDPLRDEKLPEGTAGLIIGGGFPEVYAPELSANEPLRDQVRAFARHGVIIAECAGLLYLARSLDGAPMCSVLPATAEMTSRLTLGYRQAVAPEASVLCQVATRMQGHEFHRTRILRDEDDRDSAAAIGGAPGPTPTVSSSPTEPASRAASNNRIDDGARDRVENRGQREHASRAETISPAWLWTNPSRSPDSPGRPIADGFASARLHASYLHIHWAGHPSVARRIVEGAAACRN